jgi:hypothetical protein
VLDRQSQRATGAAGVWHLREVADVETLRDRVDAAFDVTSRGCCSGSIRVWTLDGARTSQPRRPGALELVVAHSGIGDVVDAGVVLAVGRPSRVHRVDPGLRLRCMRHPSANELEHLDDHMHGVATGARRRVTDGSRTITAIGGAVRTPRQASTRGRGTRSQQCSPTRPAGTS